MISKFILGIDVGGSFIKAGIIQTCGKEKAEIIHLQEIQTPVAVMETQQTLHRLAAEILAVAKEKNLTIDGIGVGCPGPLDLKEGKTLNTPNIPQQMRVLDPLRPFHLPLKLENDANCFGLAEARFGKGRDVKILVGITLGTGFGSCLVINKQLYVGRGNATELGHTTISFTEYTKQEPQKGTVEHYISKAAQVRYAEQQGLHVSDPEELHHLAEKGNKMQQARNAFAVYGKYLGITLANAINIFDPEMIILGGKCTCSFPFFERAMHEEIKKRAVIEGVPVLTSDLKDAGVIGAAALFFLG